MKALHNLAWDRRALRILNLALCGVAFCTTVAAQAAEERPVEDDWFTAYFVEGYGFLVLFVVGIVGLLVFRKLRSKPTADPFIAKARPRVKATQQSEQVELEPRKAAPVAAAKSSKPKCGRRYHESRPPTIQNRPSAHIESIRKLESSFSARPIAWMCSLRACLKIAALSKRR